MEEMTDEEMTREEMQRFLNLWHCEGHSELKAYRDLMEIIGIAFPGRPQGDEEDVDDADENAK
ncbi:hypothetical protein [Raoultibacter phocaeensis]|uniref:hypothetical protein n=1 Tax=Raoultibacter phocaeensis TaxID=2479841 RepID=UPI001119F330|nr:hypothetical protein [Raoultibacter phocaeensis]